MRESQIQKLYYTAQNRIDACIHAVLEIRDQYIYATRNHPQYAETTLALYEIKANEVYRTTFHPEGLSLQPHYTIKNKQVFLSRKQTTLPVNAQAIFQIR